MPRILCSFLAFFMLMGFSFSSHAQTSFSKEEMIKFVNEAVDFVKKNGKEKALEEFQNKEGKFFRYGGSLYIYAYDMNGVNLALPTKPALKGKNLIDLKDADGNAFIKGLLEVAKKGKGEYKYNFENPATKKVEPKVGYVVGMGDWMLGSGVYTSK